MGYVILLQLVLLSAQTPAYQVLSDAYAALKTNDYEAAIVNFDKALILEPKRPDVHKDAAYACLKIGENRQARMHFRDAASLDAADYHAALEYAFLSFEEPEDPIAAKAEARRVFDRIRRQTSDLPSARTAEQAFQNIDRPLALGIARWKAALESAAPTFSVHYELAQLAEQRDEWELAAEHYLAAWKLEPQRRSVLIDYAGVERLRNHPEVATAALLAASRGGEPRCADRARELLPSRYPYVYEFRNALSLDPSNSELHRELAYLLLRMEQKADAEIEFAHIVAADHGDLLSAAQLGFLLLSRGQKNRAMPLLRQVLDGEDQALANRVRTTLNLPRPLAVQETVADADPRVMYERSYRAGYLQDALRYLKIAQESAPNDYGLMLKMGWTYNLLHDDRNALDWFRRARASEDGGVSAEAKQAYDNLRPEFARVRTTAWVMPFFSSRWHDAFSYGQVKTEFRFDGLPIRPYLSVRFIGDTRLGEAGPNPQALSESAFVAGVGVTGRFHGFTGWAEAGSAIGYKTHHALPDYRGGVSWARSWGHAIGSESRGAFLETNCDAVFLSRFGKDWLTYSQWRGGWTAGKVQVLWNGNLTADTQRQYWANFAETGPGVRFRLPGTPPGLLFSVSGLRGVYLINSGNPQRPNFFDVRAGLWYAFTH